MKYNLYLTACLCVLFVSTKIQAQTPTLLDPLSQPQFVNPLPIPSVLDGRSGGRFNISVTQFKQSLGLINPETKEPMLTTVWGYNGTYPGPTILAKYGVPIDVFWFNKLIGDNKKPLPHLLPVDTTLHWALEGVDNWKQYGIPIVTHVHGGQTESASDGLPLAWYTPDFTLKGSGFVKGDHKPYHYENLQEAASTWYHDHALGITRLNVYAGLAGFYVVTDDHEKKLQDAGKLPAAPYDIGLAIQDKMFTADGQLYYPATALESLAPSPSVLPEFFGDFILVNGKIWPVLEVEPRPYRFRMLNGSDSRFYNLFLSNGQEFIQLGTDNGLLPTPVPLREMLMGTGERKDILIDFSSSEGQTIILRNNAKTPYPKGASVSPFTTGVIMAFKVIKPLNNNYAFKSITQLPPSLRDEPIISLQNNPVDAIRKLILFESTDPFERIEPLLGTVDAGKLEWDDPVTENPALHSTEIWEFYNETVDAHTIHLHMVKMQLVNRQKFNATIDPQTGKPTNIKLLGNPQLPTPDEVGWKDTYISYPGEVLRIITKFDIPGPSVWHCHILSHEDHEMMRPYYIGPMPYEQYITKAKIIDATPELEHKLQLRTMPNPFNNNLLLQLHLPQKATVQISVYDSKGSLIQRVYNGNTNAGIQQFTIQGGNWNNGIYFCEVRINNQRLVRKLVLQK